MLSLAAVLALAAAPSIPGQLDDYLRPYDQAGLVSGTVLAARGGKILFHKSYGFASLEHGVRNRPETAFCVASVTKPMTISIVMQLLEAKKLAAGDTVAKFLPNFPGGDKITIVHLLNHRAGIPHRVTTDELESHPMTAARVAELAARAPSIGTPGENSVYSSAGFSVLARICEIVEGKPFHSILEERIFKPAGMKFTSDSVAYKIPRRATSYTTGPNGFLPIPSKDLSFLVGAGSVNSNPGDLFKFLQTSISGGYGAFTKANTLQRERVFWNGITSGYRTFLEHDVKSGFTIIFCGNTTTGFADRLRGDFFTMAEGKPFAVKPIPKPAIITRTEEQLSAYGGTYLSETGDKFKVIPGPGFLSIGDSIIIPVADGNFFSYRDFGTIKFESTEGKPTKLVWTTETGGSLVVTKSAAP